MMENPAFEKAMFYTTGFLGKDINELKPMLQELDAVLVDVRFSPVSESIRWREIYLKALLREKYHHILPLGNRKLCQGQIQIQNLDLGLKILFSLQTNAVLMCECTQLKDCHLFVITKELIKRNYEVEELTSWDVINLRSKTF